MHACMKALVRPFCTARWACDRVKRDLSVYMTKETYQGTSALTHSFEIGPAAANIHT
jgi:hypothetical protein